MIALLTGTLVEKTGSGLVVDVAGVGYRVSVSAVALGRLPEPDAKVRLFIRTIVREDDISLYGFDQARERDLFDLLVSVTGVGPKMALGILSGLPYAPLVRAIYEEDSKTLTAIPGLGKKTSERLILELKEKVSPLLGEIAHELVFEEESPSVRDTLSALTNLGYTRVEATRAVDRAVKETGKDATVELILTHALKNLGTP